jgi:hypothetical protein
MVPLVAVIVVVPTPVALARPFVPAALLMVATAAFNADQVTWVVKFWVEWSVNSRTAPLVAVMVVVPTPTVVANPDDPAALLTVAAALLEEDQMTCVVRFRVEWSV